MRTIVLNGLFLVLAAVAGGLVAKWNLSDELVPPDATEVVKSLRTESLLLKCKYEGLEEDRELESVVINEIRGAAPKVAGQLLGISDANLEENFQIVKYGYAGMLHVLAGQVASENDEIAERARNATNALEKCVSRILDVRQKADGGDSYYSELLNWIEKNDVEDWVHYNRALSEALAAKVTPGTPWALIEDRLDVVGRVYLERYPIERNPTLARACQELSGAEASNYCKRFYDDQTQ